MWQRKNKPESKTEEERPQRLREALRQGRIETAERTATVVDLRDAQLARLEQLNDALDQLYAEIPEDTELFDRGLSRGEPPRLWIDPIAHVHMGRDKRSYRFVQDTRYGRTLLAESVNIDDLVGAVTKYVARRILDRERSLAADGRIAIDPTNEAQGYRRRRWRALQAFLFGLVCGIVAVFATAWWFVYLGR